MNTKTAIAPVLALLAIAAQGAPASAQDGALSRGQIEFFAEMLAMGETCKDLSGFIVERNALQDWMADRLSGQTESEVDQVLALRDGKIASLMDRDAEVRSMPRNTRRQSAADEHMTDVLNRCLRMTRHGTAQQFFRNA